MAIYHVMDSDLKGIEFWREVSPRLDASKRNCRGRLRVNEKDNVFSSSEHNHESGRAETKEVVSEIRHRAVERKIIPQNLATVSASEYSTSNRVDKKMILIESRQLSEYMERKILSRPDRKSIIGLIDIQRYYTDCTILYHFATSRKSII